jgi:hypothetical protein
MVGNKKHRSLDIGVFEILDPENIHQIVCGEVNPQRTYVALAECPKVFPPSEIHPMRQPKTCSLHATQGLQLSSQWDQ